MTENAHLDLWRSESAACEPTDWERWAEGVERIATVDLDGDQAEDGYSLGWAYEQWQAGRSAASVAADVIEARAQRAEVAYQNRPEAPITDADRFAIGVQVDVDGKRLNEADDLR